MDDTQIIFNKLLKEYLINISSYPKSYKIGIQENLKLLINSGTTIKLTYLAHNLSFNINTTLIENIKFLLDYSYNKNNYSVSLIANEIDENEFIDSADKIKIIVMLSQNYELDFKSFSSKSIIDHFKEELIESGAYTIGELRDKFSYYSDETSKNIINYLIKKDKLEQPITTYHSDMLIYLQKLSNYNNAPPKKILENALKVYHYYMEDGSDIIENMKPIIDYSYNKGTDIIGILSENIEYVTDYHIYKYIFKNNLYDDNTKINLFNKLIFLNVSNNYDEVSKNCSYPIELLEEAYGDFFLKNIDLNQNELFYELLNQAEMNPFIFQKELEIAANFNFSNILEKKYNNLNKVNYQLIYPTQKIPATLHHIWLTDNATRKEIKSKDIENLTKNIKIFSTSQYNWEYILWTNNKEYIPQSVKSLTELGINIKEFSAQEMRNYDLIMENVHNQRWGMATDILRYDIVAKYGGVYADINFEFNRDLDTEISNFDFMTMNYDIDGIYIDNFFFMAKPNHPVMNGIQEIVAENFSDNANDYFKFLQSQIKYSKNIPQATDLMTANPTFSSYFINANINNNIDVIYPFCLNYKKLFTINNIEYLHEENRNDFDVSLDQNLIRSYFASSNILSKLIDQILELYTHKTKDVEIEIKHYIELNDKLYHNEISPTKYMCLGRDGADGLSWV